MNKHESSSSDGHQPKESALKPTESAGGSNSDGDHPARALSCVIGETLPKPISNKKCPADAVADHDIEENYHKETKKKLYLILFLAVTVFKRSHMKSVSYRLKIDLLPYFQYFGGRKATRERARCPPYCVREWK